MPIIMGGRKFAKFKHAVRYVRRKKGFSKKRAARYVAGVERRQHGGY